MLIINSEEPPLWVPQHSQLPLLAPTSSQQLEQVIIPLVGELRER